METVIFYYFVLNRQTIHPIQLRKQYKIRHSIKEKENHQTYSFHLVYLKVITIALNTSSCNSLRYFFYLILQPLPSFNILFINGSSTVFLISFLRFPPFLSAYVSIYQRFFNVVCLLGNKHPLTDELKSCTRKNIL